MEGEFPSIITVKTKVKYLRKYDTRLIPPVHRHLRWFHPT